MTEQVLMVTCTQETDRTNTYRLVTPNKIYEGKPNGRDPIIATLVAEFLNDTLTQSELKRASQATVLGLICHYEPNTGKETFEVSGRLGIETLVYLALFLGYVMQPVASTIADLDHFRFFKI